MSFSRSKLSSVYDKHNSYKSNYYSQTVSQLSSEFRPLGKLGRSSRSHSRPQTVIFQPDPPPDARTKRYKSAITRLNTSTDQNEENNVSRKNSLKSASHNGRISMVATQQQTQYKYSSYTNLVKQSKYSVCEYNDVNRSKRHRYISPASSYCISKQQLKANMIGRIKIYTRCDSLGGAILTGKGLVNQSSHENDMKSPDTFDRNKIALEGFLTREHTSRSTTCKQCNDDGTKEVEDSKESRIRPQTRELRQRPSIDIPFDNTPSEELIEDTAGDLKSPEVVFPSSRKTIEPIIVPSHTSGCKLCDHYYKSTGTCLHSDTNSTISHISRVSEELQEADYDPSTLEPVIQRLPDISIPEKRRHISTATVHDMSAYQPLVISTSPVFTYTKYRNKLPVMY